MMLNKLGNSKLVKLEGTGYELHHQDWDTIIEEIAGHIAGKWIKNCIMPENKNYKMMKTRIVFLMTYLMLSMVHAINMSTQ